MIVAKIRYYALGFARFSLRVGGCCQLEKLIFDFDLFRLLNLGPQQALTTLGVRLVGYSTLVISRID